MNKKLSIFIADIHAVQFCISNLKICIFGIWIVSSLICFNTYTCLGDGFLIVYSVTDRASYDHVPEFHDLILRVKDE